MPAPPSPKQQENGMKLEIEITEAEIKSAMERKVRTAIADQTNQWGVDHYIKDQVAAKWKEVVHQMIVDEMSNAPRIQEKIRKAIENKLKGQLTAMMKETK
jgi:hypothetical protein